MSQQIDLFSRDLQTLDSVEIQEVRRGFDVSKLTGLKCIVGMDLKRCTRCGSHVEVDSTICRECCGVTFCECHTCQQVASIVRAVSEDMRAAKFRGFDRGQRQYFEQVLTEWKSKECPFKASEVSK